MLLSFFELRASCSCNSQDSSFYLNFKADSSLLKGVYWVEDCLTGRIMDSARFDNTFNWNYKLIECFFERGPGCYNNKEIHYFTTHNWTIGKRVRRNEEGVYFISTDTITGTEGYPSSYKKFRIGYSRVYEKGVLVCENYFTSNGQIYGLNRNYYSDGTPQYIFNVGERSIKDGPSMEFHKNGRLKRIVLYEMGIEVFSRNYNKWGIRKFRGNTNRAVPHP